MQGGFIRAKLLLRFLGELLNCGLVEAQEYGDMLATLCAGYVRTEVRRVRQPCRDMVAYMVLSAVLRVGPTLSKARNNRAICGDPWADVARDFVVSRSTLDEIVLHDIVMRLGLRQ